jgi:spore germination protein GerM
MPVLKFDKESGKFIKPRKWSRKERLRDVKKANRVLNYLRSQEKSESFSLSKVSKALNLPKKEVLDALFELNLRPNIKINLLDNIPDDVIETCFED